jgi:hypothetical protein
MAEVNDNGSIQLFEDQKIRTAWDAEKEEWYFSIIDVISVLTGQPIHGVIGATLSVS